MKWHAFIYNPRSTRLSALPIYWAFPTPVIFPVPSSAGAASHPITFGNTPCSSDRHDSTTDLPQRLPEPGRSFIWNTDYWSFSEYHCSGYSSSRQVAGGCGGGAVILNGIVQTTAILVGNGKGVFGIADIDRNDMFIVALYIL